jgi:glycosyltransferase involved in cell wall biosynthesis
VLIQVLIFLYLLFITIQMGYVLYLYSHFFLILDGESHISDPQPVSVVICAKNEAANLRQNLPSILAQRYTNAAGKKAFEVIVVNDASTDDTEKALYELSQQYDNLWSVTIPPDAKRDMPGKKYALGKGIEHASHELLLLTDADCKPISDHWIRAMVAPLHSGKKLVAGVGRYHKTPGLLNTFVRWETMHSLFQSASYAATGKPYMAVGRNMACTRAAFHEAERSKVWDKLPSGDDDLMMRAVAHKNNTAVIIDRDVHTLSPAKDNLHDYVKQKQRHLSTGKYYKLPVKLALGAYALSHALSWLLCIVLLMAGHWQLSLGVMACRCIVYYIMWHAVAGKIGEKISLAGFLIGDIGWMVYNFAFAPYILFKNKQRWT